MSKNTSKAALGVFAITMINVIAVDSLRSLPFSASYGLSLIFYYVLAALVFFLPVAYVTAELATGWPNKGGIYIWVREAFGEQWGFVVIWLQWVYNIVWYPTILAFIAGTLTYLINPQLADDKFFMLSTILIIFWGATALNFFSLRISSLISTIGALVGTLLPMLFIILLGFVWILKGNPLQIKMDAQQLFPSLTNINNQAFLLAVLFGLVGIEVSATHADEVNCPGKTFPRAILFSTVIIFFSLVFSSLAIAIVIPQQDLNVVTGLIQAFEIFFKQYHLAWITPIITFLIIISGIASVATWVISPTKGLLVATRDGSAPPLFGKMNRYGSPVVILLLQAVICTLLSSVFLFMPSVSSSYWLLTAMTAQLAMLVYIALFAAAIYLRYKKPQVKRAFQIPGGKIGIWIMGIMGMISCIIALLLGFVPPSQIGIGNIYIYEATLIAGIIGLCLPPLFIYAWKKPTWKTASTATFVDEIN